MPGESDPTIAGLSGHDRDARNAFTKIDSLQEEAFWLQALFYR
jgi:hypothetical protein